MAFMEMEKDTGLKLYTKTFTFSKRTAGSYGYFYVTIQSGITFDNAVSIITKTPHTASASGMQMMPSGIWLENGNTNLYFIYYVPVTQPNDISYTVYVWYV